MARPPRGDFTFDEALKTMGVTPARLERLIKDGKVEVVHDGPRFFITRRSILAYLAEVSAIPIRQRQR